MTFDSSDVSNYKLSVDESPETITCPCCEAKIFSTIYAHDSGIPIFKCDECAGIWLVAGQLEKIMKYRNGPHITDKLGLAIVEGYTGSNVLTKLADLIQSRILSLIFAAAMLITHLVLGATASSILRLIVFLILAMACIWFPAAMGNITGIRLGLIRPTVTQSTPGVAVAMGGWILMFAGFCVMIYGLISH
ncbi:MAG: zf-TFIIB domain-containing protein [Planctomycetota bacterium]